MSTLQQWQEKIQSKRKTTTFHDFVREICSRSPTNMYKYNGMISVYPPINRMKVTDADKYMSDRDSLMVDYEVAGDSFFDKIKALFLTVGMPNLLSFYQNENCDYANITIHSKNIYLTFWSVWCENVMYSYLIKDNSSDVIASVMAWDNCSVVFESSAILRSHNIFYSRNIADSSDMRFCQNMQWCSECIHCSWLHNKTYCIDNIELSKEEYLIKKNEFLSDKNKFYSRRQGWELANYGSNNVTWSAIIKSNEVANWRFVYQVSWWRNICFAGSANGNQNVYDAIFFGSPSGDNVYAVAWWGSGIQNMYCSTHVNWWSDVYYCLFMENCSFCLWCVGLKNKEYCIFNKQYTKEERYAKVDEIFSEMEREWTLWSFFPWSINPFYFNDTAAHLLEPSIGRDEVTWLWYLWRDEPIRVDIPDWMETVKASELEQFEWYKDGTWMIDPLILKKVIIDPEWNSYRVVKLEYDFLVKHGLPLPRKHWLERMKENFKI